METLTWSAPEYEHKERSSDWFWALGVIVFTSTVAAIIFGNYLLAILLLLSGAMLAYLATKKPDIVHYELNDKGFLMEKNLYLYENIRAFWARKEVLEPEKLPPVLFIHTKRFFMPIISAPIEDSLAERARSILLSKNVVEEEMKEPLSERIMEALGF